MKLTRAEKIWLAAVIIFYACYNLPFVPAYGHARATLIHGLITLIPLWIAVYIGLVKVCRIYRLRDPQTQTSVSDPQITPTASVSNPEMTPEASSSDQKMTSEASVSDIEMTSKADPSSDGTKSQSPTKTGTKTPQSAQTAATEITKEDTSC